jgi:DNA-binding MarR family transcriptional regulator
LLHLSLSSTPGYLLRRCQQRAYEIFDEVLGAHGLTQRQTALLLQLSRQPGASVQDLADATGTDRNTLGEVTARLVRRGLIRRRRSRDDARAYDLRITEAGEQLLQRMAEGLAEVQRRILEPLPKKDRADFIRLARLIAGIPAQGDSALRSRK